MRIFSDKVPKVIGIALTLPYFILWLVKKTHATVSTNQIQNLSPNCSFEVIVNISHQSLHVCSLSACICVRACVGVCSFIAVLVFLRSRFVVFKISFAKGSGMQWNEGQESLDSTINRCVSNQLQITPKLIWTWFQPLLQTWEILMTHIHPISTPSWHNYSRLNTQGYFRYYSYAEMRHYTVTIFNGTWQCCSHLFRVSNIRLPFYTNHLEVTSI